MFFIFYWIEINLHNKKFYEIINTFLVFLNVDYFDSLKVTTQSSKISYCYTSLNEIYQKGNFLN